MSMTPDMRSYLSAHDLIYKSAPRMWQDGLVCGNGRMGAIFFAPHFPEFLLNKSDIWDYKSERGPLVRHKDVLKAMRESKPLDAIVAHREKVSGARYGGLVRLRFGGQGSPMSSRNNTRAGAYGMDSRLSIHDGLLEVNMDRHLSHPRLRSFVHSGDNLFCLSARDVSVTHEGGQIRVELTRPADHAYPPPEFGCRGDVAWMKMSLPGGFHFALAMKAAPRGHAVSYSVGPEGAVARRRRLKAEPVRSCVLADRACLDVVGEFDLYAAVSTSKETRAPLRDAIARVEDAQRLGFESLRRCHTRWWDAFWRRSFLSLSDKTLEQIWYFGHYTQASQYREAPAPGLQGLWFGPSIDSEQTLQWGGRYTNDQNTQIVPMPFFASNHLELVTPFYDTFNRLIPQMRRDTRTIYGTRGLNVPNTCGIDGKMPTRGKYDYIHCAGPYHGLIYAWGWRYTRDLDLLRRKLYPFLREVCLFFTDYMTFDAQTGKYRLYPSQPPEVDTLEVGNPTHTLSLLKVTLRAAIEASEILDVDKGPRREWRHLLDHYPDYPMDEGIFVEGDTLPARHYITQSGGLYPVFPCGEIGEDSPPGVLRAARKTHRSIATRQVLACYAQAKGRHFSCGWTVFFHAMQAMRLGRGSEALRMLRQEYLRCFLKPNGLFTHNAVVLADPRRSEANLANIPDKTVICHGKPTPLTTFFANSAMNAASCTPNVEAKEQVFSCMEDSSIPVTILNETVLQSHGGVIRVFPAWPRNASAAFRDFRAEGAMLVSASMSKGEVEFVTIRSLAGGEAVLKNPWPGRSIALQRKTSRRRAVFGERIEVPMRKNETVTFYARAAAYKRAQRRVHDNPGPAAPRRLRFYDGSRAWLGKPEPGEYYRG